jgi:hemerythrin
MAFLVLTSKKYSIMIFVRKKIVRFSTATTLGVDQIPEFLPEYLGNWWVHHILQDDMVYRSFFKDKGIE